VQVSNSKKTGRIVYYTNKKNELEEGIRTGGRLIRFRSSLQRKNQHPYIPIHFRQIENALRKGVPSQRSYLELTSRSEPRGAENEIVNDECPKIKLTLSKEEPRSAGS